MALTAFSPPELAKGQLTESTQSRSDTTYYNVFKDSNRNAVRLSSDRLGLPTYHPFFSTRNDATLIYWPPVPPQSISLPMHSPSAFFSFLTCFCKIPCRNRKPDLPVFPGFFPVFFFNFYKKFLKKFMPKNLFKEFLDNFYYLKKPEKTVKNRKNEKTRFPIPAWYYQWLLFMYSADDDHFFAFFVHILIPFFELFYCIFNTQCILTDPPPPQLTASIPTPPLILYLPTYFHLHFLHSPIQDRSIHDGRHDNIRTSPFNAFSPERVGIRDRGYKLTMDLGSGRLHDTRKSRQVYHLPLFYPLRNSSMRALTHPSGRPSIPPSLHPSIPPSIHPSIRPSVRLPLWNRLFFFLLFFSQPTYSIHTAFCYICLSHSLSPLIYIHVYVNVYVFPIFLFFQASSSWFRTSPLTWNGNGSPAP